MTYEQEHLKEHIKGAISRARSEIETNPARRKHCIGQIEAYSEVLNILEYYEKKRVTERGNYVYD